MSWYGKVVTDISILPTCITYYEKELAQAHKEVSIKGNLENNIKELPAMTEIRFNQLQEVEAILNFLEIQMRKERKDQYVKYERYQKALADRMVDKYVDGEDDIVNFAIVINEVSLIRNKYLGIMKAFESKNFMMGHITRLRTAGMEDIEI